MAPRVNKRRKPVRGKTSDAGKTGRRQLADNRALQALVRKIENELASGRFGEGARLPAEGRFAAELGCSRHMLRAATAALVARGLLESIPHQGAFVPRSRLRLLIGPKELSVTPIDKTGYPTKRELLSHKMSVAPIEITRMLGIARRAKVVEVMQLIKANGLIVGLATTWLPADRFDRVGTLLDATESLRKSLVRMGLAGVRRQRLSIASRPADMVERKMLSISNGKLVLSVSGFCVDSASPPFSPYFAALSTSRT